MSITLKSMRAGKVSVNEFNTYPEMLPVLMKIHGSNLPYYILEDGKMIFQGNLEFVKKEKDTPISYTLKTMNEDGMTNTSQFVNFADLSIAAAVADINHMPWFVVDNHSGKIIRQGNIDRVAAIKSGNAPESCITEEPAPETPDVDIDATIDEMNNVLGNIDVLDNLETPAPKQPVEEAVNLDLIEDAAFLDQDPYGLYHIVRVDDRILDNYMDLRYATKEKAVKHFSELNKAHVAMITFSLVENINSYNEGHVAVRSFNFDKANKDYALNAIFHIFSLNNYDIELSDELEEILDSFLKSFKREDGYYFDDEPFEICVDGHSYYIKDEFERNDLYYVEMSSGRTEKEEWRYLYNSKEAAADNCNYLYSLCIASDL